jgi:hypothetical protein
MKEADSKLSASFGADGALKLHEVRNRAWLDLMDVMEIQGDEARGALLNLFAASVDGGSGRFVHETDEGNHEEFLFH